MASLGKGIEALEDRMCTSADQASEARHLYLDEKRAEVMAKLEAFEARLRRAINWVIGGCCSCVYSGHGRRRHRPRKAMDNLKEAGQRIRATQGLVRSQGMTDGENHRDLLTRLSTALAMTEAAYLEARRRRGL